MSEVTPDQIADALGIHRPTEQQREVIMAPLAPALVVAGAGSGKTETMAFRAVYLVANGLVEPAQLLGLTFTRKAAGELSRRMRERIAQLRMQGLVPQLPDDPGAALLDVPRVSTYNSFASALFRDHAALVGYDSDAVVLGEGAAWLLAREVVVARHDLRLVEADKTADTLAEAVVRLASAISDNFADVDEVERMAKEYARLGDIPQEGRFGYESVMADVVGPVRHLPALLDAVRDFEALKRSRGYLQYSDQVRIAHQIVTRPEIGAQVAQEFRAQYRCVILDEYQDTSVGQTKLLTALFGGHGVMAVGDPHQAIYGWRGASADNLGTFLADFGGAQSYGLTTSWRNGTEILDAANRVIAPLAAASKVPVAPLRARGDADSIPVDVVFDETVDGEAREVAEWFAGQLAGPFADPRDAPSAALLLRARATLERFTSALSRAGVPYHVLGVGGLLAHPVIADLVAALRVVDDPTAGNELVRLLAGSRWRIGTADIWALHGVAGWLAARNLHQQRLDDAVRERLRNSVDAEEASSLVDALDFVATAPDGHSALAGLSAVGLERLRDAGRLFHSVRTRARLELADLVTVVLQELGLDIEAAANETRSSASAVEAFFEALADYLALGQGSTLRGFLGWLAETESRDRLSPRSDPPEPGCVQILTIHGAKGLEWDLVAVPRLVEGELPSGARDSNAWVSFGRLPYEFRGDAASLPVFAWRTVQSRAELKKAFEAFKAREAERQLDEQRRLAYVAVTRARHRLLLSGSFWSSQSTPRAPSRFLTEMVDVELPEPPGKDEANPLLGHPDRLAWPRDPLGGRRARVEAAAESVRSAAPDVAQAGRWQRDVSLLVEEHRRALQGPPPVELPDRVPASRFKDYVTDPAAVTAQLRRPMPEQPYRATRLGTLFHAWVEHRADPGGAEVALTDPDLLDLARAEGGDLEAIDATRFAQLRATFEKSPWGDLQPVEVEREILLPFAGRTVVCKIDAVYDLGGGRVEVVDWKTGKAPTTDAERDQKQLQLALYRLAYAKWKGIDPALVEAVLYFVADDRVMQLERVDSEEQLVARWHAAGLD